MNKKIVAFMMAILLAFSVVACGSSSTEETVEEVSAEETAQEAADETEDASEEVADDIVEETEDNTEDAETVEETEEVVNVNLDWVQTIYEAFIASDLDTVFEIIEAEDFTSQLTAYEDEEHEYDETFDYFTVNDDNTLVVYSSALEYKSEDIPDFYNVLVGIMSTADISEEADPDEVTLSSTSSEVATYYAQSSLTVYSSSEAAIYRDAMIGLICYMDYGTENEIVFDLSDYLD